MVEIVGIVGDVKTSSFREAGRLIVYVPMAQFPIGMPYGFRTIKTKAELLKRYRELFNLQADAAKCFAEARPEVQEKAKNQFTVGCKDAAGNETVEYRFVKTRGIWKLKSLDNLNE